MNIYNVELNAARNDADYTTKELNSLSPVVKVFSAMANGKDVGRNADKCVNHIKTLAGKAVAGDPYAVSELNTIRKYSIEPALMEEIKLLGLFGTYVPLGYDESIEREAYGYEGEMSRMQALNGDVPFPYISTKKYPVASVSVGAGFAVDYRKIQFGDMSKENELQEQIKRDIRNKASKYIIDTVYNSVKTATGVKYFAENNGITKTALDDVIKKVRRFGTTNIFGDYSVVSQIDNMIPFEHGGSWKISDAALEEIRKNTFIRMYKGCVVSEVPNGYDFTARTADGTNFKTILPEGLLFVVPAGAKSPVMSWTRGGLTSCAGLDVTTGKQLTRYDLEVACDVAKGQEYKIGLISDANYELG